jgi:hypothetical protein
MEMRRDAGPLKSGNVCGAKELKFKMIDACLAQLRLSQMSYTDQFRTFEYRGWLLESHLVEEAAE